jgi:hypothetical protein
MTRARAPFSPAAALALVLVGAGLMLAMAWMVGAGLMLGDTNDGGGHVGGRGLNGFAGLERLLTHAGYQVTTAHSPDALNQPGLLILTPPADARGKDIDQIVTAHRAYGPVLVIAPKWVAAPADPDQPGVGRGWVRLVGTAAPHWDGFLDDITVDIAPSDGTARDSHGGATRLPRPDAVMAGHGNRLIDWVHDDHGRVLAGLYGGGADTTATRGQGRLALVFEPDLLDNGGLARPDSAAIAEALVDDLLPMGERRVTFDLTLNGFGRTPNLLTLAFAPPYLAATISLLLAAAAVGWRAFTRFGPPIATPRDMGFGKRALAENAAGLIRRTGRLHLLPGPYADAARGRIIAALGLHPGAEPAETDAAIDRALHARAPASEPFSAAAARLRAATRAPDMLRAAQAIHAIERMLTL